MNYFLIKPIDFDRSEDIIVQDTVKAYKSAQFYRFLNGEKRMKKCARYINQMKITNCIQIDILITKTRHNDIFYR